MAAGRFSELARRARAANIKIVVAGEVPSGLDPDVFDRVWDQPVTPPSPSPVGRIGRWALALTVPVIEVMTRVVIAIGRTFGGIGMKGSTAFARSLNLVPAEVAVAGIGGLDRQPSHPADERPDPIAASPDLNPTDDAESEAEPVSALGQLTAPADEKIEDTTESEAPVDDAADDGDPTDALAALASETDGPGTDEDAADSPAEDSDSSSTEPLTAVNPKRKGDLVTFQCPACDQTMGLRDYRAGGRLSCADCDCRLVLPEIPEEWCAGADQVSSAEEGSDESVDEAAVESTPEPVAVVKIGRKGDLFTFHCPDCDRKMGLRDYRAGGTLSCADCERPLVLPEAPAEPEEGPAPSPVPDAEKDASVSPAGAESSPAPGPDP
ncbi:MAG: hypothetical protein R3336_10465, partial [Phycisphaeraceae bacterium]|nr:hypothetical protein [Phycisphaeraceae bacterium]